MPHRIRWRGADPFEKPSVFFSGKIGSTAYRVKLRYTDGRPDVRLPLSRFTSGNGTDLRGEKDADLRQLSLEKSRAASAATARTRARRRRSPQVFADIVAKGLPVIETVANTLPAGFPERVAGPIIEQARNRMALLTAQLEAGLTGRA